MVQLHHLHEVAKKKGISPIPRGCEYEDWMVKLLETYRNYAADESQLIEQASSKEEKIILEEFARIHKLLASSKKEMILLEEIARMHKQLAGSEEDFMQSSKETQTELPCYKMDKCDAWGGEEFLKSSKVTLTELPCYKMDRKPRGWCIIFNVETFYKSKTRVGTQHDKANLENVFQYALHFNVRCHDNPTSTEMMEYLREISHGTDHSDFDCFVCCILSHGDRENVLGSDDVAVPIKDLTSLFNAKRCRSLAGKPKLFFIQACQGDDPMPGVTIPTDIQTDACGEETIPLDADFLFGYSTVPGYKAFRDPKSGSLYIRALCHALAQYHTRYNLLDILTKVNGMVAQESVNFEGGVYKQIPGPMTTLTKQLYFR